MENNKQLDYIAMERTLTIKCLNRELENSNAIYILSEGKCFVKDLGIHFTDESLEDLEKIIEYIKSKKEI